MNWRSSGDLSYLDFSASLPAKSRIRLDGEIRAVYDALIPITRLARGMLQAESSGAVNFASDPASNKNAWNQRPRGQPGFQTFATWADGAAELKARLFDPAYAYKDTQTIAELVAIYAPSDDGNAVPVYTSIVEAWVNTYTPAPDAGGGTNMGLLMAQDLIPLPGYAERIVVDRESGAWDDLGQRTVKGFVLHRQLGTLDGTDQYFRRGAASSGLTDWGAAAASDRVYLWNSPLGFGGAGVSPNRSPWASGRYNVHGDAYGDGLAFVNKYGINAVNRDETAWEIDGFYDDPWSAASQQEAAQACAHYAHDYGIQWDQFPIHPQDGFSFVRWHQEICGPAEKACPGPVVMAATPAWIEKVRAIMKAAQTATPAQPPAPAPAHTKWAQKHPITTAGPKAVKFGKKFTATADVTPRQWADAAAPATAPDVAKGAVITSAWLTADDQGNLWIVASGGSRLPLSAFQ